MNNNDQFTISLELLQLMQWIVENDQEGLKRLITRAMTNASRQKHNPQDAHHHDAPHHGIIEFFLLMEALLIETMSELTVKNALQQNLAPAMHHLDAAACDTHTVRYSLEQAANHLRQNPQENPKELLLKELIKNWKPNKKNMKN